MGPLPRLRPRRQVSANFSADRWSRGVCPDIGRPAGTIRAISTNVRRSAAKVSSSMSSACVVSCACVGSLRRLTTAGTGGLTKYDSGRPRAAAIATSSGTLSLRSPASRREIAVRSRCTARPSPSWVIPAASRARARRSPSTSLSTCAIFTRRLPAGRAVAGLQRASVTMDENSRTTSCAASPHSGTPRTWNEEPDRSRVGDQHTRTPHAAVGGRLRPHRGTGSPTGHQADHLGDVQIAVDLAQALEQLAGRLHLA